MKNKALENIRAIAIFLVVFGHSIIIYSSSWGLYISSNTSLFLDRLKDFINVIQMPLFFSLSGFLFLYTMSKSMTFFNFAVNKVKRLIVPYVIVGLFWLLPVRMLLKYPGYENKKLSRIIFYEILLGADNGHLWFLQTLFIIFCAMFFTIRILQKFDEHKINPIVIYSIVLVALWLCHIVIGRIQIISVIKAPIENCVWFYLGFYINKFSEQIKNLYKLRFLLFFISIATVLISIFVISWLKPLGALLFIFSIYLLVPNRTNKVIERISQDSFGIYLFHSPLIYISFTFFPDINPIIMVIVNFAVFGSLAMGMTELLRKLKLGLVIGEMKK